MKPSSEYCKHLLKMAELYRDEQAARASGAAPSPVSLDEILNAPYRKPFVPPKDLAGFFVTGGLTAEGMTHILDVAHPLRVYIDDCIANPEPMQLPPALVQDSPVAQDDAGDAQG